ncbi:MAG: YARHG domain-containing protein [Bradymonadia bacterium]
MRTLALLTFLSLTLFSEIALAKEPGNEAIKADWEALLATQCDLTARNVRTPFAASVLRNTPYALAGYTFKSEGLRALFAADGSWYTPKGKIKPKFTAEVKACIDKIRAFEAEQGFKSSSWKTLKERVFKDRLTYLEIRGHSLIMKGGPSTTSAMGPDMDVRCPTCEGLRVFQLHCDDRECLVLVPGTGMAP